MQNNHKNPMSMNAGELVYYASIWLYFTCGSLSNSMIGQMDIVNTFIQAGTYASILGFVFRIIIMKKISKRNFFIFVASVIAALVMYYYSKSMIPLIIFLSLIGAEGTDSKIIGKVFFCSTGVIVILSTILSLLGAIEDRIFVMAIARIIRHSFGMTYVTIWAAYMFFLCASMIYIRRNKLRWTDYFICVIVAYVSYVYCRARLESFMLIAMLILLTVCNKIQDSKVYKVFTVYSFAISGLLAYGLQIGYAMFPEKFAIVDYLLSWRLRQTAKVLSQYDFKLFGQVIRMQGNGTVNFDTNIGYFFVDSFYINYALKFGILFIAILFVIMTLVFRHLYEKGFRRELIFLSTACYHGVIISSIILPYMNPLFLMAYSDYTRKGVANPYVSDNVEKRHRRKIIRISI